MHKVGMMFQPKGGAGKTVAFSMFAQHQMQTSSNLLVIDLDQENPTLSQYKGLNAIKISVMGDGRAIDPKMFDVLVSTIRDHEGDVIVDTGSNTFSALMAYVIENGTFDAIKESGKELYIHTIVCGGADLYDTANGFADIANYVDDGKVILWLNEHFGALESTTGIKWEDSKILARNKDKILATILLQKRTASTFGSDMNRMTASRLTFDEVDASDNFSFSEKNRLKMVRKAVFDQLDKVVM